MNLTPAERAVFWWAGCGFSAKWIARRLTLSPRTVETHLNNIRRKTGAIDRDDLIEMARGMR